MVRGVSAPSDWNQRGSERYSRSPARSRSAHSTYPASAASSASRAGSTSPRKATGSRCDARHSSGSMCWKRRLVGSCHDHRRLPASSSRALSEPGTTARTVNFRIGFTRSTLSRRRVEHVNGVGADGKDGGAASSRDDLADPRYGRIVTTPRVLAGRIPVTRVTPALPDDRWRPKAYEGEVVPFRATVFREGHDQVGAMLVLTSPSGTVRHVRMSPLAAGTDRWEARVLLDERGVWHWHVTGFDDEIATWRHDAALKIDAGVDAELMYEIGARLMERAVAEKSRPVATRRRLRALAAGLRDTAASVSDRRALVDAPALDVFV